MQKKVYTGKKEIFYNSKHLFVEYDDVIAMPSFVLLCGLSAFASKEFSNIIDIDEIRGYGSEELIEWYLTRRYRNIYMNFEPIVSNPNKENEIICEEVLKNHLASSDVFYENEDSDLSFSVVLSEIMRHKMILGGVTIYSRYENEFIKKNVKNNYPGANLVFGDVKEALSKIPYDSTFVFSDMSHIKVMEEIGNLDYSSILVPGLYRYNYTEDGESTIVDFDDLFKKHIFKLDYFSPL